MCLCIASPVSYGRKRHNNTFTDFYWCVLALRVRSRESLRTHATSTKTTFIGASNWFGAPIELQVLLKLLAGLKTGIEYTAFC